MFNLVLKKSWLFIVILFCALFLLLFFYLKQGVSKEAIEDEEEVSFSSFLEESDQMDYDEDLDEQKVIVDIKGEVKQPGVYESSANDRIYDVIQLAGGLTDEADQINIPLAQKVQDEMTIYIPRMGESVEDIADIVLGQTEPEANKVKVNQASQQELETLPGIGPAKSQAILQYIEENGPFHSPENLLEVPGIGEKTLENFRELIQVP